MEAARLSSRSKKSKLRVSRRKMLEPLQLANKILSLRDETQNLPAQHDTFLNWRQKMGEQILIFGDISKKHKYF